MTRQPNLLLLTVDALRCDRMSLHGYGRPTTPRLEELAQRAIVCGRNTALAAFTQASFPTILTSTRPLSYGGYDEGVFGRPATVFRAFHDAGYDVTLLSSFKWITRFFGYGDGVDREIHLFSPINLMGSALNRAKSAMSGYKAGHLSEGNMMLIMEPVIRDLFQQLTAYCDERQHHRTTDLIDFADDRIIRDGFDFRAVRRTIERHRDDFEASPREYVHRYFWVFPEAHGWIAADWRWCRTPGKILDEVMFRLSNFVIGLFDSKLALARRNRFKPFLDGASLANRVIRTIREHDRQRPFFIHTHFLDTHHPYIPGPGRYWYRHAPKYLAALGYNADVDVTAALTKRPASPDALPSWRALYDGAVRYTDEQIGRILDALDGAGLRSNTIVAICGDHGEELGEHGNYGHYFRLHQNNVSVPLIVSHPDLPSRHVDGLTSLMDLAPTLAALADIEPATGWEGRAITDRSIADRRSMVMETFYGGSCLFEHRPLYMAARSHRYKYLWKEYLDPEDKFGPEGDEFYDLETDPMELNNLRHAGHPQLEELRAAIAARLSEIPQVDPQRWRSRLGISSATATSLAEGSGLPTA